MAEDVNIPIIFGRPFPASTIIDIKYGKFKFQIGEKEMEFDLNKVEKYLSFTDHIYSINTCNELTQEMSRVNLDYDSLELCLNGAGLQEEEVEKMTHYLQAQIPYKKKQCIRRFRDKKGASSTILWASSKAWIQTASQPP